MAKARKKVAKKNSRKKSDKSKRAAKASAPAALMVRPSSKELTASCGALGSQPMRSARTL